MDLFVTAFTDPTLRTIFVVAVLAFTWLACAISFIKAGRPVLPAADTENRPIVTVEGID